MGAEFELEDVEIVEVKCRAWLKFGDMRFPAEFVMKPEDFENSKELRGFDLMFFGRGGSTDPKAIEERLRIMQAMNSPDRE